MNLDKQIKVEKEEQTNKKKIKQKQNGVYDVLLQLYQKHPHSIVANQVAHEVQDIYELLQNSPAERSQKTIKKIKSELSEMKCFKVPPYQQTNAEFNQIFKRDNLNIISMIAPFIQMTDYKKGHLIQVTGMKRQYIKILLAGQVSLFQPLNYKAFKNCQTKVKNKQFLIVNVVKHMKDIENINNLKQMENSNPEEPDNLNYAENSIFSITETQFHKKIPIDETQFGENEDKLAFQKNLMLECLKEDSLSANICKDILKYCGILTSITPHKISRQIEKGDFIADKDQLMFVDQKQDYAVTAICCTDCIFLEVGYEIAKQVIRLIAADRQRPFIQSLLFKFTMLKYLQAKQYVTQDYMIVQQCEDQNGVKVTKKSAVQIIKQLKVVSSVNFELSFTGQMYLITSGNVTLVIDQISEKKPSTNQYVIPQKRSFQKEILHLYKNDIFGFEDIGFNKSTNLRYSISMGSKILKVNPNVMKNHIQTIFGFQKCLKEMKKTRNELIQQILKKMQDSLQNQQIQRHEIITYSKNEKSMPKINSPNNQRISLQINQIRQLRYYGHQDYDEASKKIRKHFSPENSDIPKQRLSPEIVQKAGLGLQFSKNLMKKSEQKIQIKEGWIFIRNSKGVLLRKKKIRQISNLEDNNESKGDILLRKIGILNSKQIADHNYQIVKKRPSKYEFADLKKQSKQFQQIRQKTRSLPKLTNFYAKKEDRLFSIIYKRTHV